MKAKDAGIKMEEGYIYYLRDFTAPKVFDGTKFVCLVTDQIITRHSEIKKVTGIHISDWAHDIYKRSRFKKYFKADAKD